MASQFIVIAVLVILGHNSFISSSKSSNGSSEEVSAGLRRLRARQELATVTVIDAHQPIISILTKLASKYIYDLDCKTKPDKAASIPRVTSLGSQIGIDITVNKPKDSKRTSGHDYVTELLSSINDAIESDDIIMTARRLPKLESLPSIDNCTAAWLAEGYRLDKIAFDYMVDAIPYSLGRSCADIEKTKVAIHAYIDVIWLALALAVDLTVVGVYPENQAVIGMIQSASLILAAGKIGQVYNLFRTCSNTKEPDMLALIDAEEKQSVDNFYLAGVGILNGCRWLIIAAATRNRSPALITNIEECGGKMNTALREGVNHEFVTNEVFYIRSHLDHTEQVAVSDLAANQYATILKIDYATEATDALYDEIIYQITRTPSGIEDDGEEVFSRKDAAKAKLAANLGHGIDVFMELMLHLHPENSSNVTKACKILQANLIATSGIYIKMEKLALDQTKTYSDVSAAISDLKDKAIAIYRENVDISISLIRDDRTFDHKIEAKFSQLHDAGLNGSKNSVGSYAHALEILANLVRKDKIVHTDCENAIRDIQAAQRESVSGFYNRTEAMSQAYLLFLTIEE